jgi:hypothetical protein
MRTSAVAMLSLLPLTAAPTLAQEPPGLTLPAFTGYAHPEPERMRRDDDGSVRRCDGALHFYVHLTQTGELRLRLERTSPAPADAPRVQTTVSLTTGDVGMKQFANGDDLGTFAITTAGYHRIRLAHADGTPLRDLRALHATGPAAANAHANVAERRNAASIHVGYTVPPAHRDDVAWFHVELTPKTDPVHSYYMATGWHRGYFGMQVNSATERRLIFSVWDAGGEAIDRGKVAADDRVTLVAKGERVHAGDFGNEGTGGHSHLVHDWQLGATFRFLLHARVDGNATIYSGFFWFAAEQRWGLIASFRAPKDGKLPRGLYSFSENFSGSTGDRRRECEFGNAWIRPTQGEWLPLLRARFTHDETGDRVRLDRWGNTRNGRFVLCHGDFTTPPEIAATRARTELVLAAPAGAPPRDDELPTPPALPGR